MLTTGQVLVAGGVNFVTNKLTELASAELYNPCGQVRPVRRAVRTPDPDTPSRLHGPHSSLPFRVGGRDGSPPVTSHPADGLPVVAQSRR